MIPRSYNNTIQLLISPKLPLTARKVLLGISQPYNKNDFFRHTLEIIPGHAGTLHRLPTGHQRIDSAYRISEQAFYEKCQYKFSQWEYRLNKISPSHWCLEVAGDLFSSMVWPYRTAGGLLRVLLCTYDVMSFHSAGFYDGSNAVLVLAPSGTGKTLTTLHFLCSGGKVYNDDTVIWRAGMLLPTAFGMHFWEHRYRNNPDVLPSNMPVFTKRDRRRLQLYRMLKFLSMGMVQFGARLNVASYWPDSVPPPAVPTKIISLYRGTHLEVHEGNPTAFLRNRLWGDLEYQSLPILRWRNVFQIAGIPFFEAESYFTKHAALFDQLFTECRITTITVPARYSRDVFAAISKSIHA